MTGLMQVQRRRTRPVEPLDGSARAREGGRVVMSECCTIDGRRLTIQLYLDRGRTERIPRRRRRRRRRCPPQVHRGTRSCCCCRRRRRRRYPCLPPQLLDPAQQPDALADLGDAQLAQLVLAEIEDDGARDIILAKLVGVVGALVLCEERGDVGVLPCSEGPLGHRAREAGGGHPRRWVAGRGTMRSTRCMPSLPRTLGHRAARISPESPGVL